jgi:hypothetical protein
MEYKYQFDWSSYGERPGEPFVVQLVLDCALQIMTFEHENFVGPLPPPMNLSADKSKHVVSCFTDRDHWAHLFYEWAKNLPVKDMRTGPSETDEDAAADSDDVSDSDDDSMQRRASNR